MRASTKIALFFSLLTISFWAGYKFYPKWKLHSFEWEPVQPGQLNLIALPRNAPFGIISSNHTVSLIENPDRLYSYEKKIPLKEILETLQGNPKALTKLAMFSMQIDETKILHQKNIWDIRSIDQALSGHPTFIQKLENDLNMKLDGTPLPYIQKSAVENGILIKLPLAVTIPSARGNQPLTSYILEPYKPKLIKNLEKKLQTHFVISPKILKETYQNVAKPSFLDPFKREDIKRHLQNSISSYRIQQISISTEKFLNLFQIIFTEKFVDSANYSFHNKDPDQKISELTLKLNHEGQMRLLHYIQKNKGTKFLFTLDGIGIISSTLDQGFIGSKITFKIHAHKSIDKLITPIVQQIQMRSSN